MNDIGRDSQEWLGDSPVVGKSVLKLKVAMLVQWWIILAFSKEDGNNYTDTI